MNDSKLIEILNIIIPPIDNLPGAGDLNLFNEITRMTSEHERYSNVIKNTIEIINKSKKTKLIEKISSFESEKPELFSLFLEIIYIAYYSNRKVQNRIGWRLGPLQPQGFEIKEWDEKILDKVKQRKEFWKQI
ncbi:MAG: hypothetical protein ACJ0G8_02440 [Dehalococcoidia bacterium]